jgi:hypothetical protein
MTRTMIAVAMTALAFGPASAQQQGEQKQHGEHHQTCPHHQQHAQHAQQEGHAGHDMHARHGGHDMHRGHMKGMDGMHGAGMATKGGPAAAILAHRDGLALTADQVGQLESLKARMEEAHEERSPETREAMHALAMEAHDVLTSEQRDALHELAPMNAMCVMCAMHHGEAGMHHGEAGHTCLHATAPDDSN